MRLASQLAGWRLDVIGESKFKVMEEEAIAALASIEDLDRDTALTLYKQGFRSLDEVADASEQELGNIDGLGGPANAASLKQRAESAMERMRVAAIEEGASGERLFSDKEILLLVPGVTPRVADLLTHAGYRNLLELSKEEDIDRLAIRTGLGSKRAKALRDGLLAYQEQSAGRVDEGQRQAREALAAREAAEREAAEREAAERDAAQKAEQAAAAAAAAGEGDGGSKPASAD